MIDDGCTQVRALRPRIIQRPTCLPRRPKLQPQEVAAHAHMKGVKSGMGRLARARPIMETGAQLPSDSGGGRYQLDFMDRDDQDWCAGTRSHGDSGAHKLMVELHGAFVPRGLARRTPIHYSEGGSALSTTVERRITAGTM